MAFNVTFNSTTYTLPSVGDRLYAANVNTFLTSLANNALAKSGGTFTLTADTNFGATNGLVAKYFKSVSSNISTTGVLRLANNEGIGFRNAANGADLILKVNASDRLEYDAVAVPTISSTDTFTNKSISGATNTLSAIPASSLASTTGTGAVVLASGATLTSPAITTPTGIVKGDVGLGNVDNTSDATKNAASVSLTNKTIVSPVIDDYLELNEESAPSTPSSGKVRVYAKTDKKIYTKDSAGTESQVGASGSGELNLVENPSDSNNWSETGTVFSTPATTTTAGDLPLGGLTDTAIQLVASGNGTEADHYNSYSFTTPASLSGKMKVEFYQRPGSGFAESEWTVSVYQSTTRQSLSTDSSGVTYLVNANNKRTVYVDLLASTAYTLRFARVAGSGSATLNISNVIVGPGIQPQGAIVGNWLDFTPIWSAAVSNPAIGNGTLAGKYRQVGSSVEMEVLMRSGTTTTYGNSTHYIDWSNLGITPDVSAIPGGTNSKLGQGVTLISSSLLVEGVEVSYSSSSRATLTVVNGAAPSDIGSGSGWTAATASQQILVSISFPVSEWAGSGTVNLAQNDVEWAYSTNTVTTAGNIQSNDGLYGYGPDGTQFVSIDNATLSSSTFKRVRFQTPIQVGDDIAVEILENGGWAPLGSNGQLVPLGSVFNTAQYGMSWNRVSGSSTDIYVFFGNAGRTNSSTTFGGVNSGAVWANIAGSANYKWRVRKTSAGAAVGFGIVQPGVSSGLVSASGLPGNTTGNAIASGYVGEIVTNTSQSGTGGTAYFDTSSTTFDSTPITTFSKTLNKGTYLCTFSLNATKAANANTDRVIFTVKIGGTQTTGSYNSTSSNISGARLAVSTAFPILITADGTTVLMECSTLADAVTAATSNMSAVRIA